MEEINDYVMKNLVTKFFTNNMDYITDYNFSIKCDKLMDLKSE